MPWTVRKSTEAMEVIPGDRVTVDYADGSEPYAGTVGSVSAQGEVSIDFDDGSWTTLDKPAERARMTSQPMVGCNKLGCNDSIGPGDQCVTESNGVTFHAQCLSRRDKQYIVNQTDIESASIVKTFPTAFEGFKPRGTRVVRPAGRSRIGGVTKTIQVSNNRKPAAKKHKKTPASDLQRVSGLHQEKEDHSDRINYDGDTKREAAPRLRQAVTMMFADRVWYPGTITARDLNACKLSITFDDGDVQTSVPFADTDLVFLNPPAKKLHGKKLAAAIAYDRQAPLLFY
jgi:hypothetical protein